MNDSVISLFVNGTVSLPWVTGGGGRWPLAELSSWSRCRTGPATAWCALTWEWQSLRRRRHPPLSLLPYLREHSMWPNCSCHLYSYVKASQVGTKDIHVLLCLEMAKKLDLVALSIVSTVVITTKRCTIFKNIY